MKMEQQFCSETLVPSDRAVFCRNVQDHSGAGVQMTKYVFGNVLPYSSDAVSSCLLCIRLLLGSIVYPEDGSDILPNYSTVRSACVRTPDPTELSLH
jgi:hypothetical protein